MLEHLKLDNDFLSQQAKQFFSTVFTQDQLGILVGNLQIFNQQPLPLQKRIIIKWLVSQNCKFTPSNAFINEILRFLQQPTGGSHQITQQATIFKRQKSFWLEVTNIHKT